MPGALLIAWHASHYLINVLTAARPRCFLAYFARYGTTHNGSPFNKVNYLFNYTPGSITRRVVTGWGACDSAAK
jgi:hypothetical protein